MVRLVRSSAVALLTFFWVFATNHCALEQIFDLGIFACPTNPGAHPDQDRGCEGDGCASVENQLYKAEITQVSVTAPPTLLAVFCSLFSAELAELADREILIQILPSSAPPELSCVWQFSHRTALPPRAPSHLS